MSVVEELTSSTRRIVGIVALLNLAGMIAELVVASIIGSVSLFADAADFGEDFLINGLVVVALGWSVESRRRASYWLAGLICIPAVAALATAVWKIVSHQPPQPEALSVTAVAAGLVNLVAAVLLVRIRHRGGSLVTGAWLAARNDVLGDVLILVAGLVTMARPSIWPDVVVGLVMAAVNATAAKEVWEQARAVTPELEID